MSPRRLRLAEPLLCDGDAKGSVDGMRVRDRGLEAVCWSVLGPVNLLRVLFRGEGEVCGCCGSFQGQISPFVYIVKQG